MESFLSFFLSLGLRQTQTHLYRRGHNNRTTTNNGAYPFDSSQTCRARWLQVEAGRRPGSGWCCRWGHWEVSTWGWSETKSWMRKWHPTGRRVLERQQEVIFTGTWSKTFILNCQLEVWTQNLNESCVAKQFRWLYVIQCHEDSVDPLWVVLM